VSSYPEDKITKGMELVEICDRILAKAKESGGNIVYSSAKLGRRTKLPPRKEDSQEVKQLKDKLSKLSKRGHRDVVEAVFAFARTIEAKDHITGNHVERAVRYATEIAKKLKLSERDIEHIREAAVLHDLGKIGVSDKNLNKKSKLTKKEFEEIKKHPQIGVDIIRPIHLMHDLIPLILYHHERWDGKGYPAGLKGEEIPIGARIIAIADVYEALISNRPYRKAYSKKEAIAIIKKEKGTHFDPAICDMFLKIIEVEKEK